MLRGVKHHQQIDVFVSARTINRVIEKWGHAFTHGDTAGRFVCCLAFEDA